MPMQLSINRIQSIDVLRGAVMIIMALDHVRDFFHNDALLQDPTDLNTTTPVLFFTRWITHFCAPIFVFLSGVSAYLSGQKKSKEELSLFLIKRGLWLVFVEVVFITLAISFNPLYNFFFLQVIWAIGWSMVILGLLVRTSLNVILVVGTIIFIGHNIFDYIAPPENKIGSFLLTLFFTARPDFIPVSSSTVIGFIYAILPWTSIMLLGYRFGSFYIRKINKKERVKTFLYIGFGAIVLFIVLRIINLYGDRAPWSEQNDFVYTVLSFLNVTKYPPSLLYSLMTIGAAIIILALTEQTQNGIGRVLKVYGRVPFFYYVCHFYLIHFLCVIAFFLSGKSSNDVIDPNSPFLFRPVNFGFDLWVVYAVWLLVVLLLYKPCKWYNQYKQMNKQWWLSYV